MACVCLVRIGDNQCPIAKFAHHRWNDAVIQPDQIVYWAKAIHHHAVRYIVQHQLQFPGFCQSWFRQNLASRKRTLEFGKHFRDSCISNWNSYLKCTQKILFTQCSANGNGDMHWQFGCGLYFWSNSCVQPTSVEIVVLKFLVVQQSYQIVDLRSECGAQFQFFQCAKQGRNGFISLIKKI